MIDRIGGNFGNNWIDRIFNRIDSDQSGEISETEFKEVFSKIMSSKEPAPSFGDIDSDQSGSISKEELTELLKQSREKMPPPPPPPLNVSLSENLDKLFSIIDTNGDGVISQSELAEYFGQESIAGIENPDDESGGATTDEE